MVVAEFDVDPSGWTVFVESIDTQKVYIAMSPAGSDGYCGFAPSLTASCPGPVGHSAVGGHGPKASIGSGAALLRSGYPDWLLLKKGGVWNADLGFWQKSGRNPTERMLITSYGTGARPRLNVGTNNLVGLYNSAQYLAFVDLHAVCSAHSASAFARPMDISSGGYILMEGCRCEGFDNAPVMQYCHDIALRRNCFLDSQFGGGTYTYRVTNFLAEENLIDNGHLQWTGSSLPDHGMYCDSEESSGFTIKDNIVSRQASHGIQCRPGGDVQGNLVLEVSIGILLGNSEGQNTPNGVTGTVTNNCVLHGRDYPVLSYGQRGWGMYFENIAGALVQNNIVAHCNGTAPRPISMDARFRKIHNLSLNKNILYKVGVESGYGSVFVQGNSGPAGLQAFAMTNNEFHDSLSTQPLVYFDSSSAQQVSASSGNKFYSQASTSAWFNVGGSLKNLTDFKAGFIPPDTTSTAPLGGAWMPNPDAATIVGYMASIGAAPTLAQFYIEARRQEKAFWRPAYTAFAVNKYVRGCFGILTDAPLEGLTSLISQESDISMLVETESPISLGSLDMDSQIEVPGQFESPVPLDHVAP